MPLRKNRFQIQYARTQDEEDWLTLAEIREAIPGGKWRHNRIFEDVTVAVEMKLDPVTEFWPKSNESLVVTLP